MVTPDPPLDLSSDELLYRQVLVKKAKAMILSQLKLDEEENNTLSGFYKDFYVQISFSELHPLMVLTLAKPFYRQNNIWQLRILSQLNLNSVLGCHVVNENVGCYSFRTTQWLYAELRSECFLELLGRCLEDAAKAFETLTVR